MAKNVKVVSKGLELQVLDSKQAMTREGLINLKNGQKIKVIKNLDKEELFSEDLIVVKSGEDLLIAYADGSTLIIKEFYTLESLSLELPTANNKSLILSSNLEGSSFSIIYGQGDLSSFKSMFEGDEVALNELNSYMNLNSQTGLNAGEETNSSKEVEEADEGISTTTMVLGGLLGVGALAAAAGGGGGGGGGGSSSASSGSSGSSGSAKLVDSAVAGAEVYLNGTKIGETAIDGSFSHSGSTGDTIEFRFGQITLGSIAVEDINSDGNIMPQDLVGIDRGNYENMDAVDKALFLQSLDTDNNLANGIQIIKDANGDAVRVLNSVLDANQDGTVTQQELDSAKNSLTGSEGVLLYITNVTAPLTITDLGSYNTLFNSSTVGNNTGGRSGAMAHLRDTTQTMIQGEIDATISSGTQLDTAIADPAIKTILINAINLVATSKNLNGFDKIYLNNFSSGKITLYLTPSQINALNIDRGNEMVEARVQAGDTDLTNYDLSDASQIDIVNYSVTMNAQQGAKTIISSLGATYTIIDSVTNLTGEVGNFSAASSVTAKIASDGSQNDLSAISLDSDVTHLDLANQTGVQLTLAQAGLTHVNVGTFSIKDTAANLVSAGTSINTYTAIEVSDAASISQLTTINSNKGSATLSFTSVKDSAANLVTDGGTFASNVKIEIDGNFTANQFATIDFNKGGAGTIHALGSLDLDTAPFYNNFGSLYDITGLDTIDMTNATDTNVTLTANDIFNLDDANGDLTFTINGTNGGADTLNLSLAEGWAQIGMTNQYTATGNFDGVAGNETYTINANDVTVNIA